MPTHSSAIVFKSESTDQVVAQKDAPAKKEENLGKKVVDWSIEGCVKNILPAVVVSIASLAAGWFASAWNVDSKIKKSVTEALKEHSKQPLESLQQESSAKEVTSQKEDLLHKKNDE